MIPQFICGFNLIAKSCLNFADKYRLGVIFIEGWPNAGILMLSATNVGVISHLECFLHIFSFYGSLGCIFLMAITIEWR